MADLSPDPRTKVILFSSMVALAFIFRGFVELACLAAVALIVSFLGAWRNTVLKGLKAMAPLLVVAFILWSFTYGWSIFRSYEGGGANFQLGAFMALRLFVIILVSLNFIAMIKPSELVRALASFKLPYKAVFIMGLTLRHLYTIADDYKAVKEAQTSRGLELDKGGLHARIKNYIPVLIPLFIKSIENAEKLTLAMELRSFSFDQRRSYLRGRLKAIDIAIISAFSIALALTILRYWVGAI
ncbi:MAG: energy-coupling factor transporter transmembrane protein EcfT [Aigarchaeota archaeon]|nr:energy-coupling factor transporter transmembrane protein EcfT [Aigarchaeota archaeon]MDW8021605.1 energy-coupling factor transporter transmembrane component T [Nitrososphaerota archaeon]